MRSLIALAMTLWAGSGSAFGETILELSPYDRKGVIGDFKMKIVESDQDGSGKWFDITITLFDGDPISSLTASYICSQGIVVCGVSYSGENQFEPTLMLLDQDLKEIERLCDLEYVFSYPAYPYLMRFDWEPEDAGLKYFTDERVPPDFTGIESWKVDSRICTNN